MGPVERFQDEVVIATRSAASTAIALWLLSQIGLSGCQESARGTVRDRAGGGNGAPAPVVAVATVPTAAIVRVIDGDTLDLDGRRHRLFGIDAPEADRLCDDRERGVWRCGDAATARVQELVTGAQVICHEVPGERDGYGRLISRCAADGHDLGTRLVEEGLAWAYIAYSREQVSAEARARQAGLGIWGGANAPAWERRAQRRRDALAARTPDTPPDPGCPIKGNRSSSGRIYHLPGSRDYDGTRIDPRRGERWFCSEAEAVAAGWRPRRR